MNRFRCWLIRALGGELPETLAYAPPKSVYPIRIFEATAELSREIAKSLGEDSEKIMWERAKESLFASAEIDQLLQRRVHDSASGHRVYQIKIALVDANKEETICLNALNVTQQ